MRIVFIGSTSFGLRCLKELGRTPNVKVAGIITAPQKFSISYASDGVQNVLHADFREYSLPNHIPSRVLSDKMSDPILFEFVYSCEPDCLIVIGWHHMVPNKWLLTWPTFGIHASLLPKYSGGAPLVWAIINGEKVTGTTLFRFDDGVDSGPIIDQRRVNIKRSDSIATLYKKIEGVSVRMLKQNIIHLLDPQLPLMVQDKKQRSVFPQRNPTDGQIKEKLHSTDLRNFVRAQTRPYPGAFIQSGRFRVVLWKLSKWRVQNIDCRFLLVIKRQNLYVASSSVYIKVSEFDIQEYRDGKWVRSQEDITKILNQGAYELE
jgi:methionyl-tRNA formyltransferase